MSENVFTKVGDGIKTAAIDTAHVAEKIVGALPKAAAVLADALKDEPQIKTAVLNLIAEGSKVVADSGLDIASKGTNLVEDAATVSDAESFCAYFRSTFVPAVATLYSQVKADITAEIKPSTSPAK